MARGNKGEWSEFYTFLRLLADREMYGADENLQKISDIFYPVLKIIREEATGKVEYELKEENQVKIIQTGTEAVLVNASDLKKKVTDIFRHIKNSNETTFEISLADELMAKFKATRLNAGSVRKEDIVLQIHDHITNTKPEVGFSFKSMLGSPATLLNASAATNFIFSVTELNDDDLQEVNRIQTSSKLRDRIALIKEKGGQITFKKCTSDIFAKNLRKVDTVLPEILSTLLLSYYQGEGSSVAGSIDALEDDGIQITNYILDVSDVKHKVGGFLRDVALGMVPSTTWDGNMRAHGGYIIVREDGEIVCYHVYNTDSFREYLLKNTKFETPSTTRHQFGNLYMEDGEMLLKLNLQIRFIK